MIAINESFSILIHPLGKMIIAAYLHGNISVSKTLPQALSTETVFAVNLSLSHTQTAFQVTENRPFGKLHPGWKYLETSLSMFIDGGQQQRCLEMMMKTLIFASYLGLISVWSITAKWVFEIVHWWNGCLSIYLKRPTLSYCRCGAKETRWLHPYWSGL